MPCLTPEAVVARPKCKPQLTQKHAGYCGPKASFVITACLSSAIAHQHAFVVLRRTANTLQGKLPCVTQV